MDPVTLMTVTTINCFLNLLFIPFAFSFFYRLKQKSHCHFWAIFFQIHFSIILFTITNFILGICCLFKYNEDSFISMTFFISNIIGTIAQQSLAALFLLLFVERFFATLKRDSYEKMRNFKWIFFGSFTCWIYGGSHVFAWNVLKGNFGSVMGKVSYGMDAVTVVCSLILWKTNYQLKKLHSSSRIVLTNRYQIYENIRMLRYSLPFLFIGTFAIIFGGLASRIGSPKDKTANLYYFLLINIWMPFVLGYEVVYNLVSQSSKINRLKQIWYLNHRNTKVTSVTNNFNIHEGNIDHHFGQLKDIWKA